MSNIITRGSDTIAPTVIDGFRSERESRNVVHPILGRDEPDVTLRPSNLRTGTLTLGFEGPTSEARSKAAEDMLAASGVFTLASTERATAEMSFIIQGTPSRELEDETRDAWIVTLDFQEVSA